MNVPLNQANIAPKGVSPRHTLALDNFDVIKHDIAQVGHVIVDNCFPVDSVQELSNVCLDFFSQYDQAFKEGKMNEQERQAHLNSTRDLPVSAQKHFTSMVHGSELLNLMRFLLGNVSIIMYRNDQCFRKLHADYPLRSVGLHYDTQFVSYVDRTFTLWLPLVNVLEDSPTILYLDRSLHPPLASIDSAIRLDDATTPDEASEDYSEEKTKREKVMFDFIKQHSQKIYAPRLNVGSAIIFCHDVLHGTFMNRQSKGVRYSLDCRFSVDFDRSMEPKMPADDTYTLNASPAPASTIRTITFHLDEDPSYNPHTSHPDIENGTPTYEGYRYARKYDVDYDFNSYDSIMPHLRVKDLWRSAKSDSAARRLLRLKLQKDGKNFIEKLYTRYKDYRTK